MGQGEAQFSRQFQTNDPGILRSTCFGWPLLAGDALNQGRGTFCVLADGKDVTRELSPACLALCSVMIGLAKTGIISFVPALQNFQNDIGNIKGRGWITHLIFDHFQAFVLFSGFEHRFDEVLAKGGIDPGGSEDQMVRGFISDRSWPMANTPMRLRSWRAPLRYKAGGSRPRKSSGSPDGTCRTAS